MKDSTGEDRVASAYYREVGTHATPTPPGEKEDFTRYAALKNIARARLFATAFPDRTMPKNAPPRKGEKPTKGLTSEAARSVLGEDEFKAFEKAVCQDSTVVPMKKKLACGYLKFVIGRAGKRSKNPELVAELIGEGNAGLMIAIDKFEVDKGFRFLTYAACWIDCTMREHLNRIGGVHMPSHARKKYRKQRAEEDKLIAAGVLNEYTVQEPIVSSLENASVASDLNTEDAASDGEFSMMMHLNACGLSRREKVILVYYYALRSGEPKTFRDLAKLLHRFDGVKITSERVRQVKERAVKTLHDHLTALGIQSVSDVF